MVATGQPEKHTPRTKIEIIDVSDPTKSCVLDDNMTYPHLNVLDGSTGGILGTTPVICGGYTGYGDPGYLDTCLLYGTSRMIKLMNGMVSYCLVDIQLQDY